MVHAARRVNKTSEPKIESGIYLVPMHLAEAYYHSEVACKGVWDDDPPVIVVRPAKQIFRATDAWVAETFAQMKQVRRPGTNRYVFPAEHGGKDIDIDIGLIDVRIHWKDYSAPPTGSPRTDENFALFDRMCAGTLHTQMVMATGVHHYSPDGSRALSYHNLIFALRKQIEPDEHSGVIDLLPVIHALGTGRTINIVEEVY